MARMACLVCAQVLRHEQRKGVGLAIPRFVEHTLAFLEREENIGTLGLFRVTARKSDIEALRQLYDEGGSMDMVANAVQPHTVANALKLYLRSLPETLLTARAYPRFIEIAQGGSLPSALLSPTTTRQLSCFEHMFL